MIGYVIAGLFVLALLAVPAVLLRRAARRATDYQRLRDAGRSAQRKERP